MAGIPDRAYNAACGMLASQLSISLAAARRNVDVRSSQQGLKEPAATLAMPAPMLAEAQASGENHHELLSAQLEAVGSDENFMVED